MTWNGSHEQPRSEALDKAALIRFAVEQDHESLLRSVTVLVAKSDRQLRWPAVLELAWPHLGVRCMAIAIMLSTFGCLNGLLLMGARLYYAMSTDGLFFRAVAKIHPKTQVPIVAIALQGVVAIVITLSGTYEQILSYVVSVDFIFFGLTGLALFVFRRRLPPARFRTPAHPVTTALFVLACWAVVATTIARAPMNSAIGLVIVAAGLVAYLFWRK